MREMAMTFGTFSNWTFTDHSLSIQPNTRPIQECYCANNFPAI